MTKNTIAGGLLVNKAPNATSHDVVAHIRKSLSIKQVGHTGTLDPFATGLLIILIGKATRVAEYLHDFPKTYETKITLGANSDTDDPTGTITPKSDTKPTEAQVIEGLQSFRGKSTRFPPAYAAIKVNGIKMYEAARRGESIVQKSRTVTIHDIQLIEYKYPTVSIRVTCSTGTYIRAIARDLGNLLSTGAYASTLHRTSIGQWNIENARNLEEISTETYTKMLIPIEELIAHLEAVTLPDTDSVAKFRQGRALPWNNPLQTSDSLAIFDSQHAFVGIGKFDGATNLLSPHKVF